MGEYKGTAATVWHLSPLPQWLRALAPFAPSCPAAPNRTALFLAMLSFCLSKALQAEPSLPGTCPAASAAGAKAALCVWPPVPRAGASWCPRQDSPYLLNCGQQVCWRWPFASPTSPTDQAPFPLAWHLADSCTGGKGI